MKKQKYKPNMDVKNIQKVTLITTSFFIVMYLVTALITGEIGFKKDKKNNETPATSIQYKEILAGEVFNRSENEYYVIFYKFDNKDASTVQTILDDYASKEGSTKIYTVDLSKGFNKSIYTEGTTTPNVNTITNLKVGNHTLIKIANGKNVSHVEGRLNISDYFADLTK